MYNLQVNQLMKALFMKRTPVGIKFIAYKQEFDSLDVEYLNNKGTFCSMVQKAMNEDVLVKANSESFSCGAAAATLGIDKQSNARTSGRTYQASKMYKTLAIAHNVNKSMMQIENVNYGVLIGPLNKMDDCDVVIMIGTSREVMRIMQGYSYHYGAYEGLKSIGMQAVCSDLAARPFMTNNINISLMCCGARVYTKSEDGEMGIAVPVNMFENVVDGVVQTINYMEYIPYKRKLEENYDCEKEFGIKIDHEVHYGKETSKYMSYSNEIEKSLLD